MPGKLATNIGIILGASAVTAGLNANVVALQKQRAETQSKIDAVYASDPNLPPLAEVSKKRVEIAGLIKGAPTSGLQKETWPKLVEGYKRTEAKLQQVEQHQTELKSIETKLKALNVKLEDWANSGLGSTGQEPNKFSTQALRPEYKDEDKKTGWRAKERDHRTPEYEEKRYQAGLEAWNKDVNVQRNRKITRNDGETDEAYQTRFEALEKSKQANLAKLEAIKPKRREAETDEKWNAYLEKLDALRQSDSLLTKHFTEEERANSEVRFDEEGRAVGKTVMNPDGTAAGPDGPLKGRSAEFVMSKTGQMHQFKGEHLETGEEVVDPVSGKMGKKKVSTHHSSVLGGEEVAAAGEMTLNYEGYLTEISNKSGHYRPGATQVIQLLEELARQGALLDKNYVMPDENGKGVPLFGQPLQIYNTVAKIEAGLDKKLSEGKNIEPELAGIKQARQVLAKLGAAPANKFREVEVTFLGGEKGGDQKTGQAFKGGDGEKSTAEKFLKTGGGNKEQAKRKADMLKEVHQRANEILGDKLEKAEKNAEALADKVSEEMAKTIKELPEMFKHYQEEFEAALKDKSANGPERRKQAVATLLKIEAVANMEKTLDDLKALYEKDKAAADPLEAWNKEVEEFGAKDLSWDDYGGKEKFASLLGISADDLVEEGLSVFNLVDNQIGGCKSDEELYEKLTGKKKPSAADPLEAWNKEVEEFGAKDLSWDDYGGKEKFASLLGISADDLVEEGLSVFNLVDNQIGGCKSDEELYEKLTGKKKPSAADPLEAWNKEVEEFGAKDLSWDDYGGKEKFASLLGISADDLVEEGLSVFNLVDNQIGGCKSDEELYEKLTGKKKPG